ncbi:MAG: hypothetical protein V4547_16515 [Bacteroidota bacterium]
MKLFEDDFGEGGKEVEDDVNITTTLLYFSDEELTEFKTLAKAGIKKEFGQEFQQKGNLTDFLLIVLRKNYGTEAGS